MKHNQHAAAQFTLNGTANYVCVFYQITVDRAIIFQKPPFFPPVMQVSLCRGTYAESVPPEYTQLEGMCLAFRRAEIHNGMKISLSGVSLLNPV